MFSQSRNLRLVNITQISKGLMPALVLRRHVAAPLLDRRTDVHIMSHIVIKQPAERSGIYNVGGMPLFLFCSSCRLGAGTGVLAPGLVASGTTVISGAGRIAYDSTNSKQKRGRELANLTVVVAASSLRDSCALLTAALSIAVPSL